MTLMTRWCSQNARSTHAYLQILKISFGMHVESTNPFWQFFITKSFPEAPEVLFENPTPNGLIIRNPAWWRLYNEAMRILQVTISRQRSLGGLVLWNPWALGFHLSNNDPLCMAVWECGHPHQCSIWKNVAPRPIKPKSPIFCCAASLFFCSAKPCLAVRHMENSHGNGVEQRILADNPGHLASPTQSPSKEATKVKLPSSQERVWITSTTQNSWINRMIKERS